MNTVYYTYLIGWSQHNKWYYGVRFSKNSNPSELWSTYFTSSKHVKSFRAKHGEPDIISIRKKFSDPQKAKIWEHTVLKKLNLKDPKWLNQCANLFPFNSTNKEYMKTAEYRNKISIANKGKTPWNKGKSNTRQVGTKFYNNGVIQKMFRPDQVPAGWYPGRINKSATQGTRFTWINNGKNNKRHDPSKPIPENYTLGYIKLNM